MKLYNSLYAQVNKAINLADVSVVETPQMSEFQSMIILIHMRSGLIVELVYASANARPTQEEANMIADAAVADYAELVHSLTIFLDE